MDYSKSGNAKNPKGEPRFGGHGKPGTVDDKQAAEKAALLARLKAAAEAKKQA
jgi:hypothetical protein